MTVIDSGYESSGRDDRALVLVIDDDPALVSQLTQQLHQAGYRSAWASDGSSGIGAAEQLRPHAILLDVDLPGMSGLAVCRTIKGRLSTADTPVIFLADSSRSDELVSACFEAGGHDVLGKPVNRADLLGRCRVVLREHSIRDAYRRLAILDPVTGLSNRRQFFLRVTEAVMRGRRSATQSHLILADIDGTSAINQKYGYELGDEVILTFARLVKRLISPTCKAGRVGGEEFGIVATDSTSDWAVSLASKLGRTFASIAFDAETEPKHFSVGFGIARYEGRPRTFNADVFMTEADVALFSAKQLGRGRVVGYWDLDPRAIPEVACEKRHARSRRRRRTQRSFLGARGEQGTTTPAPPPVRAPV
jgi:diguanylate cyclase (GGDEF)-like protein